MQKKSNVDSRLLTAALAILFLGPFVAGGRQYAELTSAVGAPRGQGLLGTPAALKLSSSELQHRRVTNGWSTQSNSKHWLLQSSSRTSKQLQSVRLDPTGSHSRHQHRRLADDNNVQFWDMPGDGAAGEHILQSLDPLLSLLPLGPFSRPAPQPSDLGRSSGDGSDDSNRIRSLRYQGSGSAELSLQVVFVPVGNFNATLRLPMYPRMFYVTIEDSDSSRGTVGDEAFAYKDQLIIIEGLAVGTRYTITLFDQDDDGLVLAEESFTIAADGQNTLPLQIQMQMLQLEASFGSLAWAGPYPYQNKANSGPVSIHAQIVGAQVEVYTKGAPSKPWDAQYTGDDGTANFFVVPKSSDFFANMSVGDTLLTSVPLSMDSAEGVPDSPQLIRLTAVPQLLCTGEVEDIRGESGQFPSNITAADGSTTSVYHPRGFYCRWELIPDYPELILTVDYTHLLPDESITLYLGPKNVIRLQRPLQDRAGGVFQATIYVERSIFVEFQTTRTSTSAVGSFSITWASANAAGRALLDSRTMVVVLAIVSAAGAVLAALCFYCMCCGRRRRGAVVVDLNGNAAQHMNLLRVPSAVRTLLPSKPYQPPAADNPLPGAPTEPDCCSICLVEFEAQENVTVLPCMHFYHKECIDSWLKRNCTCPLCKANVLEAFTHANGVQPRQHRRSRHHRRHQQGVPAAAASDGSAATSNSDAATSEGSSESRSPEQGAASAAETTAVMPFAWAAPAEIELPSDSAAAADREQTGQQQGNSAVPGHSAATGDALVSVRALPRSPTDRQGRLPSLQQRTTTQAVLGTAAAAITAKSPRHSSDGQLDRNAAVGGAGTHRAAPMSPAASLGLQSGTVDASPADFAAAAAAAAAALAAAGANTENASNGGSAAVQVAVGNSAWSPAQASVAALRSASSNSVWGRLHGLLRTSSGNIPADAAGVQAGAAAPAGSSSPHHTVEMAGMAALPPIAGDGNRAVTAGSSDARSNSSTRVSAVQSPGNALMLAPLEGRRVAVSIYAYAGHPQNESGADIIEDPEHAVVVELGHAARQQRQQ